MDNRFFLLAACFVQLFGNAYKTKCFRDTSYSSKPRLIITCCCSPTCYYKFSLSFNIASHANGCSKGPSRVMYMPYRCLLTDPSLFLLYQIANLCFPGNRVLGHFFEVLHKTLLAVLREWNSIQNEHRKCSNIVRSTLSAHLNCRYILQYRDLPV